MMGFPYVWKLTWEKKGGAVSHTAIFYTESFSFLYFAVLSTTSLSNELLIP